MARLASEYARTCISPDDKKPNSLVVSENSEVFVWGSNSSHQLAEGSQEKILLPKMAISFAESQQVRLSQYESLSYFFDYFSALVQYPKLVEI